jgi:hypothetical protein
MTEDVRSIALRLVEVLGHSADPDSFSDEDAWSFMIDLRQYAERHQAIPPQAVVVLHELAGAIGLYPGAPAEVWAPALEYELGPSPYTPDEVAVVMKAIHAAVNGEFESGPRQKIDEAHLTGGRPAEYTPNKNLDFGDPRPVPAAPPSAPTAPETPDPVTTPETKG